MLLHCFFLGCMVHLHLSCNKFVLPIWCIPYYTV